MSGDENQSTWLVTGTSGFLGRNLLEILNNVINHRVITLGRQGMSDVNDKIVKGDFSELLFWNETIEKYNPNVILNLAGATPPESDEKLWNANYNWIPSLVKSLEMQAKPIKLVHVGSAAELGEVPVSALPVAESYPAHPVSAYGKSKFAATNTILNANLKERPVVARLFNLCGPGQGTRQAWGRYAAELYASRNANKMTLKAFGLSSRRDFIDIRDAAAALIALANNHDSQGLYHVGRGSSHSIREGLDILIQLSKLNVNIVEEPALNKGPDDSIADNRRIIRETEWRPLISIEQSLSDLWQSLETRVAP
jgi:GDP-4-dehydro-6-deoxy-D-mannose reductase